MKLFHKDYLELHKPKEGTDMAFFEEVKRIVKQYNLSYFTGYRWLRNGRIPVAYKRTQQYMINGKTLREFRKKSLRLTVKQVVLLFQFHYKIKISPTTIHMYESGYYPVKTADNRFVKLVNMYKIKAKLDFNPIP